MQIFHFSILYEYKVALEMNFSVLLAVSFCREVSPYKSSTALLAAHFKFIVAVIVVVARPALVISL